MQPTPQPVWNFNFGKFPGDINLNYYSKAEYIDPFGPATITEQVILEGSSISHYYISQSGTRIKLHPDQYNQYTGLGTVLVMD